LGNKTQIWATGASRQLYLWDSTEKDTVIRPTLNPLPGDVGALTVATRSEPVPVGFIRKKRSKHSFFTNFHAKGNEAEMERVVVVGDDGALYWWGMEGTLGGKSSPHWISGEFDVKSPAGWHPDFN
jgi:hypothetical protein